MFHCLSFFQNSIDNGIPPPPRIGLFSQIQLSEAVEPPGLDFRMQVKKKSSSKGSIASEICIWKNSQDQGVRENQIISTVLV